MEINPDMNYDLERKREVNYKFFLPENAEELKIFQVSMEMQDSIQEIYDRCRFQWKYNDKATDEMVTFAEELGELCWPFLD